MRLALLVLALLVAGCAESPSGPPASPTPTTPSPPDAVDVPWHLGGAWTSEYTQADIDAWCEIAREYRNECIVMESFPPQYALRFSSEAQCLEARDRILALEHITARACVPIEDADGDPDGPVSSAPEWALRGTFAPGYTADDMRAVCVAGTGNETCAMMKSEPPQYSFRFATRAECDEARAAILRVASARPGECVEVADA